MKVPTPWRETGYPLPAGVLRFNQFLDGPVRHGYLVCNHVPDNVVIKPEVAVYQSVAHAGHSPPFPMTILLLEVIRHLLRCLTNDLDTAYELPLQRGIARKLLLGEPLCRIVQDATQVHRRQAGHIAPLSGYAGQCKD